MLTNRLPDTTRSHPRCVYAAHPIGLLPCPPIYVSSFALVAGGGKWMAAAEEAIIQMIATAATPEDADGPQGPRKRRRPRRGSGFSLMQRKSRSRVFRAAAVVDLSISRPSSPPPRDQGEAQARDIGQRLKGRGITAVVSSAENRTIATAAAITSALGLSTAKLEPNLISKIPKSQRGGTDESQMERASRGLGATERFLAATGAGDVAVVAHGQARRARTQGGPHPPFIALAAAAVRAGQRMQRQCRSKRCPHHPPTSL